MGIFYLTSDLDAFPISYHRRDGICEEIGMQVYRLVPCTGGAKLSANETDHTLSRLVVVTEHQQIQGMPAGVHFTSMVMANLERARISR